MYKKQMMKWWFNFQCSVGLFFHYPSNHCISFSFNNIFDSGFVMYPFVSVCSLVSNKLLSVARQTNLNSASFTIEPKLKTPFVSVLNELTPKNKTTNNEFTQTQQLYCLLINCITIIRTFIINTSKF